MGTEWKVEERVGNLRSTKAAQVKMIEVPIVKSKKRLGHYDLYYFVRSPSPKRFATAKTVLFCAGGPAQNVMPDDDELWLESLPEKGKGFHVVYFHIRGAGLSQLPPSNEFDKYLRVKYVIDDLEEIRRAMFPEDPDRPWDAVIGYSFGSLIAQQYASIKTNSVKSIILIGPMSLDRYETNTDPIATFSYYSDEIAKVRAKTIDEIYSLPAFIGLAGESKNEIKRKLLSEVYPLIETKFGSEQFLIDNYAEIKNAGLLKDLPYSYRFFTDLLSLRDYGFIPFSVTRITLSETLEEIGKTIAGEFHIGQYRPRHTRGAAEGPKSQPAYRAFYNYSIYDGTNRMFWKEWLSGGRKNAQRALHRSVGKAYLQNRKINPHVAKIKIDERELKSCRPWNPTNYFHQKPMLLLKGGADPVSAGLQVEQYQKCAPPRSNGPAPYLIELEGIGHQFILPKINVPTHILDEACQRGDVNPIDCLVASFVEFGPNVFRKKGQHELFEILDENRIRVIRSCLT